MKITSWYAISDMSYLERDKIKCNFNDNNHVIKNNSK